MDFLFLTAKTNKKVKLYHHNFSPDTCRTATKVTMSVLSQLLKRPPGVMEGLELPFYSPTPGVLGSSSFPLPLWCPVKVCAGDVAWISSNHMSDPSPSSSHDDGAHAVSGEKKLVRDGIGPEYSKNSSRVLGVEGGQFVKVAIFSHPPAF